MTTTEDTPVDRSSSFGDTSTSSVPDESSNASFVEWRAIILIFLIVLAVVALFALAFMARSRVTSFRMWQEPDDTTSSISGVSHECCGERILCSFPYGRFPILPMILVAVGLALSVNTVTSCNFLSVYERGKKIMTIGFWLHSVPYFTGDNIPPDTCVGYYKDNTQLDAFFWTARIFGLLSSAFGLMIMIYVLSFTCAKMNRTILRWSFVAPLFCTLIQGLTLLAIRSDFCVGEVITCELSFGAASCIFASIYWFLVTMAIALIPLIKTKTPDKNFETESEA